MRTNDEPFRKRVLSDCQAILMVWRINFRKAGANYSPLQQNHPKRSIHRRSNPLEKTAPNLIESFASKPDNS
jgi:hypothetical protein